MKILLSLPRRIISLVLLSLLLGSCDSGNFVEELAEELAERGERRIAFYGLVVYEDAKPAGGAVVSLRWSHQDSSKAGSAQHASEILHLRTDQHGKFSFHGMGRALRVMGIEGDGKLLYEEDGLQLVGDLKVPGNLGYRYNEKSGGWYVASEENPAVFVLVRQGHRGVKAWPSRGGKDCFVNGTCITNSPEVPKQPSVDYQSLQAN